MLDSMQPGYFHLSQSRFMQMYKRLQMCLFASEYVKFLRLVSSLGKVKPSQLQTLTETTAER